MDTILLLMAKVRDRRLLEEHLRDKYQLATPPDATIDNPFDLCILDGPALTHFRTELLARKAAEGEGYLPVLLVTAKRDVSLLTGNIWQIIDEVISTPIQKAELHARVEVLLRARRQAQALLAHKQQQLQLSQTSLQQAEQKFSIIFAKSSVAAALSRAADGVLVDVNEEFERVFGFTRAEALGKSTLALGIQRDVGHRQEILDELNRQKSVRNLEQTLYTRSGEAREFAINLDVIEIAGDFFILSIARDITEQRRAEAALRASEARFRSLFQNSHATMLVIDPTTGCIFDANPAASAYYGWDVATLRNMNIADINILSPAQIKEEMVRAQTQQRNHFEFRHRRADGSIRDVEVFSGPIHMLGRNLLYSLVFDVTERKQLEEQLRQAQKMETVGQLAGGVAHDFNNMLAVILLQTELALMQLEPHHPLYNRFLEIRKAAERSARLTQQLLGFARKQIVNPKVIDLNDAIAENIKMLRRLIREDITLSWSPTPDLWPVRIDPGQIDQILTNLCVNARDAIAGVGSIFIEAKNVTIDVEYCRRRAEATPGDFVMLSVSDTGAGIDPTTLKHIFEPFFTTKEVGKGTGLGLATVYGIVKQNDGFINVYSEPDMGATFKVYLPRYHASASTAAPNAEANAIRYGQGETILLVEDEPAMLESARLMLEQLGYRVLAAATPREALQLASALSAEIDLVLTDVIMPEMNGYDLVEQIRRSAPHIQASFMSGYSASAISHRGLLREDVVYIQKPFSTKELSVKLRTLLEQR
ncbi:MAG TPA: hypothetical protein DCL15_19365 [Chloroflexi bacterium]|nr:hypothetical protein [Chloroflexota bacterium]HHW87539.1 PAS domain S-box protein [Chloroflexota bacterium]